VNLHILGHALLGWGIWLTGVAVGYIAANRDLRRATRRFALACLRREQAEEDDVLERTLGGGVSLGPLIAKCKEG
jgi:hypothetical protein